MEYNKLEVWIEARKLTNLIYDLSKVFPKEEIYGLTNQMRRCSVSIPSNIAEGCGRNSDKDFCRFLYIAFGSANELEYQILLSIDLKFIQLENLKKIKASRT